MTRFSAQSSSTNLYVETEFSVALRYTATGKRGPPHLLTIRYRSLCLSLLFFDGFIADQERLLYIYRTHSETPAGLARIPFKSSAGNVNERRHDLVNHSIETFEAER